VELARGATRRWSAPIGRSNGKSPPDRIAKPFHIRTGPPTQIRRLFRFSFVFLSQTGRTHESSDDARDDDVLDAWLDEDEIDASGL
jgi:hypothetical protein